MPKLSIVTINFNNKSELQSTIESVLKQTFTDFEYIIIDGGSSDGSVELLQFYDKDLTKTLHINSGLEYNRQINNRITYWISEPDKGIYDALNKGIEQASGEWIMFLNSGDYLPNNTTLESIFKIKRLSKFDVLFGSVIYKKTDSFLEVKPSELSSFFYKMPFCHQSSIVKTSLLKVRKFNVQYKIASDYEFFCQMYRERKSFRKIKLNISVFSCGGVSNTNTELMYKEFSEISFNLFNGYFRKMMFINYRMHVVKRKLQSLIKFNFLQSINYERKIRLDK